jgi:hypothetical protein
MLERVRANTSQSPGGADLPPQCTATAVFKVEMDNRDGHSRHWKRMLSLATLTPLHAIKISNCGTNSQRYKPWSLDIVSCSECHPLPPSLYCTETSLACLGFLWQLLVTPPPDTLTDQHNLVLNGSLQDQELASLDTLTGHQNLAFAWSCHL